MKKLALGFLSVFILLGGVLFSACNKKVELTLLTSEEITIVTNDDTAENFEKDTVEVEIKNSNAGIVAEILEGSDVVKLTSVSSKGTDRYSFDIQSLETKKSGKAKVKVSSIEDETQNKIIHVNVNTILDDLQKVKDDNVDAKSSRYVVKGSEEKTKLNVKDYFEFYPITANDYDFVWSFEDGGTTLEDGSVVILDGTTVLASIKDDELWVSNNFNKNSIILKATDSKKGANATVEFDVLENSTIDSLVLGGDEIYKNGLLNISDPLEYQLVRNNLNRASLSGEFVVNTNSAVEIIPFVKFYNNKTGTWQTIEEDEWRDKYFSWTCSYERDVVKKQNTYNFEINVFDDSDYNKFGDLKVDFRIQYEGYTHFVDAKSDLTLKTYYQATTIEVLNENGESLTNATSPINIFSNYVGVDGYKFKAIMMPDDVGLIDDSYWIVFDENPNSFATFYYRGRELVFEKNGDNFVSEKITNGAYLQVVATEAHDVYENVEATFIPCSNAEISAKVKMNFYKISKGSALDVEDLEVVDEYYIASSLASDRKLALTFKIFGLSTAAGINVENANNRFKFSPLSTIEEGDEYVIVSFEISLEDYAFEDFTKFYFKHISGKISNAFVVNAFVPLETVSMSNADSSAVNAFKEQTEVQAFALNSDGEIEKDESTQSESLSSIMIEAGTSLPISIDTKNATLSEKAVEYKFLTYDNLKQAIMDKEGLSGEEELKAEQIANYLLKPISLSEDLIGFIGNMSSVEYVSNLYPAFENLEDLEATYFSIDKKLNLLDQEFKGFVCAVFNGYDVEHNSKTLLRFFGLESFYKVNQLASDVETAKLYTSETLSDADIGMASAYVTLSLRADQKVPTYTNNLSLFTFISANNVANGNATPFEFSNLDGSFNAGSAILTSNGYYSISDIGFGLSGRTFKFKITANSTKLQSQVRDILKIVYLDENGFRKETEIQIEIKNVKRIESLEWITKTIDNEIYFNLNPKYEAQQSFTISTSFTPSDAYDASLTSLYVPVTGNKNDLEVIPASIGQTINLTLTTNEGGYGYLYLLPSDMVKKVSVGGIAHVLLYKYGQDENGNIIETPVLKPLESSAGQAGLKDYFEQLVDPEKATDEFDQYFYNIDGEKIYYKDLILRIKVIIADGSTEEMALRLYSQSDLEYIANGSDSQHKMYYQIINDIALEGWRSLENLDNVVLFGKNEDVTLNFTQNSKQLFGTISAGSTIRDLTLTGEVSGQGFVASQNNGTIENVNINIYYSNGVYKPSVVKGDSSSLYVGAFVGVNSGTISNSYNYGVQINANSSYAGGIAGNNDGSIVGCGVEFYNFVNQSGISYTNSIAASMAVGGLAGHASVRSRIKQSYVYAYSLLEDVTSSVMSDTDLSSGMHKGVFVGHIDGSGAILEESFGYLGSLSAPYVVSAGIGVEIKNSYISYSEGVYNGDELESVNYNAIVFSNGEQTTLVQSDINNTQKWDDLIAGLDGSVWEVENINNDINFGYMYLKNIRQSRAKDVNTLEIQKVESEYLKALNAGSKTVGEKEYDTGILFAYDTVREVVDPSELYVLKSANTIYLKDLFGISAEEAESLLLISSCKDIGISKNSLTILSANLTEFEVEIHSKMNFSYSKAFKFVILNGLPHIKPMLDGQELLDGQVMLLQTGSQNSRNVVFDFDNSIYLGGEEFYETKTDDYSLDILLDGVNTNTENVSKSLNGKKLSLIGLAARSDEETTKVLSKLSISGLGSHYNNVVGETKFNSFEISTFNGASSLIVNDTDGINIKPSESAPFEVVMMTDNAADELVFALEYEQIEIAAKMIENNYAQFVVDSKLTIDISWTVSTEGIGPYTKTFNVLASVAASSKALVDKPYELSLIINAKSMAHDTKHIKVLPLNIKTQDISDVDILTYKIESRQIKNSTLYLKASSEKAKVLAPSSDVIVSVVVDPAYALMTHFTLTYSLDGYTGTVGTLNISSLSYNDLYGYYVDSSNIKLIENGLRVSKIDRAGKGIYYFRLYASGAFESKCDVKLTLTYYNNQSVIKSVNQYLSIDTAKDAEIKVNGVSNYIMPKGSSATVTVTLGLDQKLYDLSLEGNGANISLSAVGDEKIYDTYKVYTATLTAYVDAILSDGKDSGMFNVVASVSKITNGVAEIKQSKAKVYLVDFAVDGSSIKVNSSGATATYNGREYDVFHAYINATQTLSFDYSILPEEYIYNSADTTEVGLVEELKKQQNQFIKNSYYKDAEAGYYINYSYNLNNGSYKEITLKQQLSYVTAEDTYSKIHNGTIFVKNYSNDIFNFSENSSSNQLQITGKLTGKQLMRLQTTIICQGVEFVYDYYFLIAIEVWSDEEAPTQISSGEMFVEFATNSEKPDDYILMNDIVLENYSPLDTDLIDSLDGNGYTIHLNSFAEQEDETIRLALFNEVKENTTLKNVRVNIYGAGEIKVDISKYKNVEIAGFALKNSGIIYNCEVVSYFDDQYQTFKRENNGLVVEYVNGKNTDPIQLSEKKNIGSSVSGFVDTNNGSITNSRVGGESFKHIIEIDDVAYIKTEYTDVFVIQGQGNVSGFVRTNGSSRSSDLEGTLSENVGYISASFVSNVQINNQMEANTSVTAGFVIENNNNIQGCYVEGLSSEYDTVYNTATNITAMGYIAGFVYENEGLVKNSYANIAIENEDVIGFYVAGFVYKNNASGEIQLCFAACKISDSDVNEMKFSGVNSTLESLNEGSITTSYYYNSGDVATTENEYKTGPLAISDMNSQDVFYGFSFASDSSSYDGIWSLEDEKLFLISANKIAISNRYVVSSGNVSSVFYNKTVLDSRTLEVVDLSYGSSANPIIIRNAEEFAKATGKATSKEISAYKEYYNDKEVRGNYRLVNNIIMSEIDQNAESDNTIKLTTTQKTFKGVLDGNGFTISEISLGSNNVVENFGLFAKLENSVVMNLNLIVNSIHNRQAAIVGTLAGTAVNSRILAINITPLQGGNETSILGNNVVGGVVGMIFGDSKIHDVAARNMKVYSSYQQDGATIVSNDAYTGEALRVIVKDNGNLVNKVSNISYAGAIVGYADIYKNTENSQRSFGVNPNVANFNIVTVHVYNSVDIYGEVVGGLFGYVGPATKVYDASIELDANDDLANPSYIISRNLYAGGLVGEHYGVLFGSYASYEKSLQKTIEEEANSYYVKGDAERGQLSIFSYASPVENIGQNTNQPLFIGGLVGYMGGGYIYVGYNKLNVASYNNRTLAVGGVVGFAANAISPTELSFSEDSIKSDVTLYDVYSSGDVFVKQIPDEDENEEKPKPQGVAAGIIGAIEGASANSDAAVVTMKNVLAVNHYGYEDAALTADTITPVELDQNDQTAEYKADKHYMLVGKVYSYNDGELVKNNTLSGDLYLLNSANQSFNVYTGTSKYSAETGSKSVGGYQKIYIGDSSLYVLPYGFENTSNYTNLLDVTNIGYSKMKDINVAHAQLYTYFLPVGWTSTYWEHNSGKLYPDIQLLPTSEIIYLDAVNANDKESIDRARNVLKRMENEPALTVIVRGRVNPDNNQDLTCTDVDLSAIDFDSVGMSQAYAGRFVSYSTYYNNEDNIGKVTQVKEDGGRFGDNVGIILNKSMFENLGEGALIEALTFYHKSGNGAVVNYSLIKNSAMGAVLNNVSIVESDSVSLTTEDSSIGLIAKSVSNSSFVDVEVVLKKKDNRMPTISLETKSSSEAYMGLLAGKIEQSSTFTQSSISDIDVYAIDIKNNDERVKEQIAVNYQTSAKNIYAGLYAGEIIKDEKATARISVGLSAFENIRINVVNADKDKTFETAYIGGYAGVLNGVDQIGLLDDESGSAKVVSNIEIVHDNVNEIYAGMLAGNISAANLSIAKPERADSYMFKGGIYQMDKSTKDAQEKTYAVTKRAHIGGLAGEINAVVAVSDIDIEFVLAKENILTVDEVTGLSGLEKRLASLKQNTTSYGDTYAYSVMSGYNSHEGSDGLTDNRFGAYFGNSKNAFNMTGSSKISGLLDVSVVQETSVGAILGKSTGAIKVSATSIDNSMSISVVNAKTTAALSDGETDPELAYIGGIVGNVTALQEKNVEISTLTNKGFIKLSGDIVVNAKNVKVGGAVGYIGGTEWLSQRNSISDVVYGGAIKIYGEKINGGNLSVGGIVGEYSLGATATINPEEKNNTQYSVSNCYTYGDVLINYDNSKNDKLASYNFGGIIGSASCVKLTSNYSLMTSFNNRLSGTNEAGNWSVGVYNVGAIVGASADACVFGDNADASKKNYYNSGVCLAYQEQASNIDALYGENEYGARTNNSYLGYSSLSDANSDEVSSSINLLSNEYFGKFVATDALEGTKLKPYTLNQDTKYINKDSDFADKITLDENSGKTNGISWVAVSVDYEIESAVADELKNVVLVGNGHTITQTGVESKNLGNGGVVAGGIVNMLGASEDGLNFNAISGLVVELDLTYDFVDSDATYGGVAGKVDGNSYIFGVATTGEASLGGNKELDFGGIVGTMEYGFINECAMNANLLYRANDTGKLFGVGKVQNGNTTIKATYTSGRLETYVDEINIYALAYGQVDTSNPCSHDVVNCYSISNIKRSNVAGTEVESGVNYLLNSTWGDEGARAFQTSENFFIRGMDIAISGVNPISSGAEKSVSDMALGYKAKKLIMGHNSLMAPKETVVAADEDFTGESLTKWYFSPYVNFGFASHGFGYMKNVTAYTRASETVYSSETNTQGKNVATKAGSGETETQVVDYAYQQVGYQGILMGAGKQNWYLGINNFGKFDQMITACCIPSQSSDVQAVDENDALKFVLTEDFEITHIIKNNKIEIEPHSFGMEIANFELDGDNHAVDFKDLPLTTSIFASATGTIENIKFNNVSVVGTATLANSFVGTINNVEVVGNLTSASSGVTGGVVGTLEGEAVAVDSLVNISTEATSTIIGGVVGKLESGKITYSTNNGIIISSPSEVGSIKVDEEALSTEIKETELGETTTITNYTSVVGGIVGYAASGAVTYSYNTNAVLSGYSTDKVANYIAGGVIGYAQGVKITNCYNTGLVGAGNYGVTTKNNKVDSVCTAFAGGIFGYGAGSTSATNCINDGAVEAISYTNPETKRGTDYTITTELTSGVETTDDWNSEPDNLVYDITMTYNPGDARQVFAYGIGVIGGSDSGSVSGCSSSTQNIKNDGNIGQISDTKTMEFNRSEILSNSFGQYKGKFKIEGTKKDDKFNPTIYVNGYDSYLFPARIYIQDTMTRGYFGGEEGTYSNSIEKAERTNLKHDQQWMSDVWVVEYSQRGEDYSLVAHDGSDSYRRKSDGNYESGFLEGGGLHANSKDLLTTSTNVEHTNRNNNANFFENENGNAYIMAADTTYYESVEFVEYDAILDGEYGIGIFANVNGLEQDKSMTTTEGINEKINNVNKIKDSAESMKETTVNGISTAVVFNGDQLFTSYNPYYFKVSLDSLLDEMTKDQKSSLSKNDFSITAVKNASGADVTSQMQISMIKKEKVEEKDEWFAYGYFAEAVDVSKVDAKVEYTVTSDEISLGNNNVVNNADGSVRITLTDNQNSLYQIVSDCLLDDATEITNGVKYEFKSINIGGATYDKTKVDLDTDESKTTAYATISGLSAEELNEQGLTFNYTISQRVDQEVNINIESTPSKVTAKYEISTVGNSLTFKDYVESTFTDLGLNNYVNTSTDTINLEGIRDTRETLGGSDRIVIKSPIDDSWSIVYNGGVWTWRNGESTGNLIEGEAVSLSGSGISITEHVKKGKVYYSKTGDILSEEELADNLANTSSTIDGITFETSGFVMGASSSESFTTTTDATGNTYGKYTGTAADFATLVEKDTSEESSIEEIEGVKFYKTLVEYSRQAAADSKLVITNNTGSKIGYTSTLTRGENYSQKIGVLANGESIEYAEVQIGDNVSVDYYKELKIETDFSGSSNMNNVSFVGSIIRFSAGDNSYEVSKFTPDGSDTEYKEGNVIKNVCPLCGQSGKVAIQTRKMKEPSQVGLDMVVYGSSNTLYTCCGSVKQEYFKVTIEKWADGGETTTRDGDENNTAGVDILVGDYDNKGITFVDFGKISAEDLTFDAYESGWTDENEQKVTTVQLYYSNDLAGVSYTVSPADDWSNLRYKEVTDDASGKLEDLDDENKYTITENRYGQYKYEYYYETSKTEEISASLNETSDDKSNSFEMVYIAEDLSIDKSIGTNDKKLYGGENIVKFVSDHENPALIKENSSTMQKLDLINIVSLEDSFDDVTLVDNKSTIKDMTFYGNIRNAELPELTTTIEKQLNARAEVDRTISLISGSGLSNVKSNMSITSIANFSFKDVPFETTANDETDTEKKNEIIKQDQAKYLSQNVIIAADGQKGENGEGVVLTARAGMDGSVGGSVTVDSVTFAGLAKAGLGGIGGYGANGEIVSLILNKYASGGGAPGWTGKTGTVSIDSDEKVISQRIGYADYITKQRGGNGAVGSIGAVVNAELSQFKSSSGGGGSGGFVYKDQITEAREGDEKYYFNGLSCYKRTINSVECYRVTGGNGEKTSKSDDASDASYSSDEYTIALDLKFINGNIDNIDTNKIEDDDGIMGYFYQSIYTKIQGKTLVSSDGGHGLQDGGTQTSYFNINAQGRYAPDEWYLILLVPPYVVPIRTNYIPTDARVIIWPTGNAVNAGGAAGYSGLAL